MKKLILLMVLLMPMIAFTGCGDDDDEPMVLPVSLKVYQTYDLESDGWVSDNPLIAKVEGSIVTGVRAGSVNIRNGKKRIYVTVVPTFNLLTDPCVDFGATEFQVMEFMRKLNFEQPSRNGNMLVYTGTTGIGVVAYGYTFDNNKLTQSIVTTQAKNASSSLMAEYLTQRYVPVVNKDDYIGLVSPDKSILVVFTVQSNSGTPMYVILYAPNPEESKSAEVHYDSIVKSLLNNIHKDFSTSVK